MKPALEGSGSERKDAVPSKAANMLIKIIIHMHTMQVQTSPR